MIDPEEKLRAQARKSQAWAEAEAEFEAWYQDLSTRASLHTGGHAGIHYGRTLTTSPKCSQCGRATAALGLCDSHYNKMWRQKHRPARGLRMKAGPTLCGHEPFYCKGLCKQCYDRTPDRVKKKAAAKRRLRVSRARKLSERKRPNTKRLTCGCKGKRHHARGLCARCYNNRLYRIKQQAILVPRIKKVGYPGVQLKQEAMWLAASPRALRPMSVRSNACLVPDTHPSPPSPELTHVLASHPRGLADFRSPAQLGLRPKASARPYRRRRRRRASHHVQHQQRLQA